MTPLAIGYGAVFAVPSSDGTRSYRVALVVTQGNVVRGVCTCSAAAYGRSCRHVDVATEALAEQAQARMSA